MLITIIAWVGTIGSIISNLLVANKNTIGAYFWCVATLLLLINAIYKGDKSQIFLFFVYEIINIFMAIKWSKDDKK